MRRIIVALVAFLSVASVSSAACSTCPSGSSNGCKLGNWDCGWYWDVNPSTCTATGRGWVFGPHRDILGAFNGPQPSNYPSDYSTRKCSSEQMASLPSAPAPAPPIVKAESQEATPGFLENATGDSSVADLRSRFLK